MRTLSFPWHHEMDRLLTEFLGGPWSSVLPARGALPWNLSEDETAYHLTVELPGVAAEDVELSLENQVLNLQVQRHSGEDTRVRRRERWEGTLRRSMTLPDPVMKDQIEAELKNGVLQVTVPKAPEARPHRIQIQGS